jgi:hypothetical protein
MRGEGGNEDKSASPPVARAYCAVVSVSKRHGEKLFMCLLKKKKLTKRNFLFLITDR